VLEFERNSTLSAAWRLSQAASESVKLVDCLHRAVLWYDSVNGATEGW